MQALLVSYPRAARHRDDQGMLPIHLAIRIESPVPVVQLLLMAYPAALDVQDRKGRIPLVLVQNSRSALKNRYMEALGVVQGYHAVASAAFESELANECDDLSTQLEELCTNEAIETELSSKNTIYFSPN